MGKDKLISATISLLVSVLASDKALVEAQTYVLER